MKNIVYLLLVFVYLFLYPKTAFATSKSIISSGDTYVNGTSGSTTVNYGSNQTLRLRGDHSQYLLMLVKFSFSDLAEGQKITSAKLRLYQNSYTGDPVIVTGSLNINKITSDWNESTVNWSTRPNKGGQVLPQSGSFNIQNTVGYQEFDITQLTQDWIDKVVPNYGIYIESPLVGWSSTFDSKEGQFKPTIVIEYNSGLLNIFKPVFNFIPGLVATPTPTPTSTPTPSPEITPTPTPTNSPTPTPTPTTTPKPSNTPIPTSVPEPTQVPEISEVNPPMNDEVKTNMPNHTINQDQRTKIIIGVLSTVIGLSVLGIIAILIKMKVIQINLKK